ncbi:MAG TPA: hypothetical protein VLJ80_07310 [Solirubrobacteraceae bacterium]|nr:hypothetical protein [Solirubrobacteraceae bacterium]
MTAAGVAEELGRELAEELPAELAARVSSEVRWEVPVVTDELAARGGAGTEVIDAAHGRVLGEDWHLGVVLTDLPLRIGRRPVVADASATHGVAVVSLPALGAVQMRRRARDAVVRLVDGLVGESLELGGREGGEQRRRVRRRLQEIARAERTLRPDDDDVDVRLVAAVVRGNVRLLAGMLRANRPWRLIARLSRALAAAGAALVFALVTAEVWHLAAALSPWRLGVLSVISTTAVVVFLILVHGLWRRRPAGAGREQAILFNVATTLTLTIGVASLYAVLFVIALGAGELILQQGVVSESIGAHVSFATYLKIAWMTSSLATVAGALGAGLESDAAVREAAYGYRAERETEREGEGKGA